MDAMSMDCGHDISNLVNGPRGKPVCSACGQRRPYILDALEGAGNVQDSSQNRRTVRADCPICDGDGFHEYPNGTQQCVDCAGYGTLDAVALATMVREMNAALEEQSQVLSNQQSAHEDEMEQDGRARAMMIELCRDLGVSIYTDATRGIRDEMHRRKALLRRCFDWWGQDDVGRLVYADLCRNFGVPVDEPGICSTGLTAEPVDSRSINPGDLHDTERSS